VELQKASINLVSPEYFGALRIPLLEGRLWSEMENHNGAHLAVINGTLAQRLSPERQNRSCAIFDGLCRT
jgi:hypothetical protein